MITILLDTFLQSWSIVFLFLIIAILYSSVGFGGGSSYLAVLALSGLVFTQIRSLALICNIIVVSSNVFVFINDKQYEWKRVIPIVLMSIPLAFIGGYLQLSQNVFFILLGFTLLFSSMSMWFSNRLT